MAKKHPKEIVEIPLRNLKPHPLQAELYGDRADWQIEELAKNMEGGLTDEVEILPDRTIISGHGRVQAAKRLGWKTIKCWVRHDLAQAGPSAAEKRLIDANLIRRQMSMFDMARSYRHLKRIAQIKNGGSANEEKVKGDLRDMFAKRFGVSGRTLDRWLQILDLPMPIQQAVESHRLPLTVAVRIAALDPADRAKIEARIQAGEDPAKVVAAHLPEKQGRESEKQGRESEAGDPVVMLCRALKRVVHDLDGRVPSITPMLAGFFLPALESGRALIDQLITQCTTDGCGRTPGDEEEEEE